MCIYLLISKRIYHEHHDLYINYSLAIFLQYSYIYLLIRNPRLSQAGDSFINLKFLLYLSISLTRETTYS